ncbi:hypothetical protein JAAARDRAFT_264770 [Jaapia argillacea MUCL 33604]|uniref:Uncharacterized protein n=1 Tax=Jaapia argillacea MUCL 33604 TaxID=933084 RepID=A0A067Q4F6_9AGAM|nr:hypothetical protein JAAARDRAFT_264770 [Jaapia argillacea MUCL 33604]
MQHFLHLRAGFSGGARLPRGCFRDDVLQSRPITILLIRKLSAVLVPNRSSTSSARPDGFIIVSRWVFRCSPCSESLSRLHGRQQEHCKGRLPQRVLLLAALRQKKPGNSTSLQQTFILPADIRLSRSQRVFCRMIFPFLLSPKLLILLFGSSHHPHRRSRQQCTTGSVRWSPI